MQLNPKLFGTSEVVQQFHIVYSKETGQVLDLMRSKRTLNEQEDFIVVPIDNALVLAVMTNKLSITQLLVAFDKDTNQRALFKKDQYLRQVREDNISLYKIDTKQEADPSKQLTVALYDTGVAEVYVNKNSLNSFVSIVNNKNEAYKGFDALKFFLVNATDPVKLYATLTVDTTQLINDGRIKIDLPWYSADVSKKVAVYTKRVFSTYQVVKSEKYIATAETVNDRSMQYMSDRTAQDDCHIGITIKPYAVEINSRIVDPIKFKIFDELHLHVVKKNDPNQYIRTIKLTVDQLKNKGTVLLENVLDDTMAVVHDNPSIKINLRTVNESTNDRV